MTGNACFITNDFSPGTNPPMPGGCAYYRCYLPSQAIAQAGYVCKMGFPAWNLTDGFGVAVAPQQALFGFRFAFLKLLMASHVPSQIRAAQQIGQKIIVDVDDAFDHLPESNLAHLATDPAKNRLHNREHYREVIKAADIVTVTTPFLKDYYDTIHPNVVMIRNGVLPEQFTYRKTVNRKPVIGWVGGVPWRGNDLEIMRAWLPEFLETHDLMFHHSGHAEQVVGQDQVPAIWELAGIPRERVTTSPLRSLVDYHEMFTFDIGVIPLSDIPFNHAKSNLKGLEYACSGIPFVASALPEYQYLQSTGVGRVARTPDDWWREMTALLGYKTRMREAAVNAKIVREQHSIMERETEWQSLLRQPVASAASQEPVLPAHAFA